MGMAKRAEPKLYEPAGPCLEVGNDVGRRYLPTVGIRLFRSDRWMELLPAVGITLGFEGLHRKRK